MWSNASPPSVDSTYAILPSLPMAARVRCMRRSSRASSKSDASLSRERRDIFPPTLLARLATKGYDIFTDDICVLQHNTPGDNRIFGSASYPMMKLWDDAISQLDSDIFTRDLKVRP